MERENLAERLKNVRLTSKEVYDDAYREFIRERSDSFDPKALRALLAIRPGHAFQATIVLREDFHLINGILVAAGPLVVPRSPCYQEVASLIRAILPEGEGGDVLDRYLEEKSYIYSQPIASQWNPVLATMSFFSAASDTTPPDWTDGNGSITVSLSCL